MVEFRSENRYRVDKPKDRDTDGDGKRKRGGRIRDPRQKMLYRAIMLLKHLLYFPKISYLSYCLLTGGPMNKHPKKQNFWSNFHWHFFLIFARFVQQIGLDFGPICLFAYMPYIDTKNVFLGIKKKCFAENQNSVSHLLLCNIFFVDPLHNI